MATMMTANVSMVIMPNQRKSVARADRRARRPIPKWGKESKQRSTHNNYITLPVLFMMLSNHYPVTYANSRDHSRAGHLRHRRRRADPLFLQHAGTPTTARRRGGLGSPPPPRSGPRSGSPRPARPACAPTLGLATCRPKRPPRLDRAQGAGRSRRRRRDALLDVPCGRAGLGGHRRGAEGRAARYARAYRAFRVRPSACRRC